MGSMMGLSSKKLRGEELIARCGVGGGEEEESI